MKRLVLLMVVLLALSGCAVPKYNYSPLATDISEPPLYSVNIAYVGDNLLRQGTYTEHDAIYVKESTSVSWGSYKLTPGYFLKTGEDEQSEFYKPSGGPESGQIVKAALSDPWQSVQAYKHEKKLCVVTIFNGQVCNSNASFERRKRPALHSDSFQQTLIYSGTIGNKINIGYREYSNNFARPAFNNEVEYDLSQSNIIGYKGAKIEVLESTNEYIRYKVIKNFNRASAQYQAQESKPPKTVEPQTNAVSSGTAFFITSNGLLVSNHHVINECKSIKIKNYILEANAEVLFKDEVNDLAILKSDVSDTQYASLRGGKGIRAGEDIITVGYPLGAILGENTKVTKGNISSVTGIANDTSMMQITAPIQPGSSGGPVIDMNGNIVGIVSSKLNEVAVAKATGSLPQNINFAIKSQTMQVFLDTHNIDYKLQSSDAKLEPADIAKEAEGYTVHVTCSN